LPHKILNKFPALIQTPNNVNLYQIEVFAVKLILPIVICEPVAFSDKLEYSVRCLLNKIWMVGRGCYEFDRVMQPFFFVEEIEGEAPV
jgi:hypothetical protein